MEHIRVSLVCLVIVLLVGAKTITNSSDSPQVAAPAVPKGKRSFGVYVNPPQDGDFGKAFARVRSMGGSVQTLSLNWTDIESAPGKLGNPNLGIANAFYPVQKTRLILVLRPINTNRKETPADLMGKPFDDPIVTARFKKVMDYVFEQTPQTEFSAIAIGNEVEGYLGSDSSKTAQYRTFYEQIRAYIHSRKPNLRVGVVVGMNGLLGPDKNRYRDLNRNSDVILTTYYPLNPDFTVKPPDAPRTNITALARQYSGRTIVFTEAGYPSSDVCKSSEQKQAEFIRNVFATWDQAPEQVESIVFQWMSDLSPDVVKQYQSYYGATNSAFGEYLRTLGLRTYEGEGRNKPAFTALKEEAKRRGW